MLLQGYGHCTYLYTYVRRKKYQEYFFEYCPLHMYSMILSENLENFVKIFLFTELASFPVFLV